MDDEYGPDVDFGALAEATERSTAPSAAPSASNKPSTAAAPKRIVQPTPQTLPTRATPSSVLVSPRQKGNPILTHIQSLPWEYTDTPADYVLGATTCALFLSLKYHRLHPEYIYTRIRALGQKYNLRVLLTMVDIDNHEEPLRELAKTSLVNNLTLILAWSAREAARYLEAYKQLERAAPTAIKGAPPAAGHSERVVDFVTVPRGINKADAVGLLGTFGSMRAAINAAPEEVASVQGWGEIKVKRWHAVVREPFRMGRAKAKEAERDQEFVSAGRTAMRSEATGANLDIDPAASFAIEKGPSTGATTEVRAWEPGEDDEEAMLLADEQEDLSARQEEFDKSRLTTTKRSRYEEPELEDGIAAALAKLRRG